MNAPPAPATQVEGGHRAIVFNRLMGIKEEGRDATCRVHAQLRSGSGGDAVPAAAQAAGNLSVACTTA